MNTRMLKINAEIKRVLSEIFLRELENPTIDGMVSIVKVNTMQDLDICKVYISIFNSKNTEDAFNAIKHSASYIRKLLASRIIIRKVPYLEFYLDKSSEALKEMEDLIATIKKDELDD